MEIFSPVFVSHHQFQVFSDAEGDDCLGLYTLGDDLLQVTGQSQLTVLTGPHTGEVAVSLAVLSAEPGDDVDGWDAAAETTMWCTDGRISICGLMSGGPDELVDVATGHTGLLRVRVLSRNRQPDGHRPDPRAPEQYRVDLWPVDEDTGFRSLRTDGLPSAQWSPERARAAGWAMLRLISSANPDPREAWLRDARTGPEPTDPPAERVLVRRQRNMPSARALAALHRPDEHLGATADGVDLVLPAGELEIRLRQIPAPDGFTARWRWNPRPGTATAVPDTAESTVHVRAHLDAAGDTADLTVIHRGVRVPDAALLGLIWDQLLDRVAAVTDGIPASPHPWMPMLDELAARSAAEAEAHRRDTAAAEARRWGGTPPAERVRRLSANTIGLAGLDRELLDALAEASSQTQRAVARWGARQACAIAGLDTVDWIASALTALDHGDPLPTPFDDEQRQWARLWADPRVPSTTVTTPDGTPNFSQQAIALPTIRAAVHEDPLAAAVDTVYFAALSYGDSYRDLLAAATTTLGELDRRH